MLVLFGMPCQFKMDRMLASFGLAAESEWILQIEDKWGNSAIDTLKMFGDAGIKINSTHYQWYLKLLDKLNIDPKSIAKKRNK